jgi:hypothetical protein
MSPVQQKVVNLRMQSRIANDAVQLDRKTNIMDTRKEHDISCKKVILVFDRLLDTARIAVRGAQSEVERALGRLQFGHISADPNWIELKCVAEQLRIGAQNLEIAERTLVALVLSKTRSRLEVEGHLVTLTESEEEREEDNKI